MKEKIAFSLIMGVITTGIISFSLISINVGYTEKFFAIWFRSWLFAYLIVVPAILIIGPQVQKFVSRWFGEKNNG